MEMQSKVEMNVQASAIVKQESEVVMREEVVVDEQEGVVPTALSVLPVTLCFPEDMAVGMEAELEECNYLEELRIVGVHARGAVQWDPEVSQLVLDWI